MNFEEVYRYDKDVDTVLKMFSDRTFFERKYSETALSYEVAEHELSDDKFHIRCKLTLPSSAPVPGFAKKILGETMHVVQQDDWDLKSKTGELKVEIAGAPIEVGAKMTLKQGPNGAENHLAWTVKCKLPLIGGKIERLIADDIQAKAGPDLEVSRRLLEAY